MAWGRAPALLPLVLAVGSWRVGEAAGGGLRLLAGNRTATAGARSASWAAADATKHLKSEVEEGHWRQSLHTGLARSKVVEQASAKSQGDASELGSMRLEIRALHDSLEQKRRVIIEHRHKAGGKNSSVIASDDMSVEEMQRSIEDLEKMLEHVVADEASRTFSHDELKSQLERLRIMVERLEYREVLPLVEDEKGKRLRMRQLEELKEIRGRMYQIDDVLKVTADAETRRTLQSEKMQLQKQEQVLEEMLSFRPEDPHKLNVEIDRLHKELGKLETVIPKKVAETGELRVTIPMKTVPVRVPIQELHF